MTDTSVNKKRETMPKVVDKEAKKNEIVQAAIRVFAKKGVANTKMADIARAVGIGKGTIYEYFKNKNEIFTESFNHYMEMVDTVMGKQLFKVTDPVQKLKALIIGWTEIMSDFGYDYIEVMLEFWAEGIRRNHDGGMGLSDMNKLYADYRTVVKAILDEGIRLGKFKKMNTTLTASILIGALDGLMLQWILDKSLFTIDDAATHLFDEFLQGIIK